MYNTSLHHQPPPPLLANLFPGFLPPSQATCARKFVNPLIDHDLTMSVDCGRKFAAFLPFCHPHTHIQPSSYEEPWGQRGVARPAHFQCLTMDRLVKCQEQMDLGRSRNCTWGKWAVRKPNGGLNRNLVVSKVIL